MGEDTGWLERGEGEKSLSMYSTIFHFETLTLNFRLRSCSSFGGSE